MSNEKKLSSRRAPNRKTRPISNDQNLPSDQSEESAEKPDDQQNRYHVGYCKPPREHRFPKKTSGNPKGRPKSARSFKTEVLEVLNSKVTVTEGGKSRKITTSLATLHRLRQRALSGDLKAIEKILLLALQHLQNGEGPQLKTLLQEDEELLKEYRRQIKEGFDGNED